MSHFLIWEIGKKQEILGENDAFRVFEGDGLALRPLILKHTQRWPRLGFEQSDALLEAVWGDGQTARFAVKFKRLSTPLQFREALLQIRSWELSLDVHPLVFVPYLKFSQLEELDELGLSGIDLCGNAVVTVTGCLKVFRSGSANRFRSNSSIKNVYRGMTSMVARLFATEPSFPFVQAIRDEIAGRDRWVETGKSKPIGLSAVSKALKS